MDPVKLGGRYRLEEEISSGGMGIVFAARDERLNRTVAIKLLRDELVRNERFVERLRREARSVAGMTHPNIAIVFDYGEDESHCFIVMELARGRDLARLIKEEGPLDAARAITITIQICRALDRAHAAGIVHRDIKPANVIVDDVDQVKVTDFGIARAVGDATLTETGKLLGSVHYLSPEQATDEDVGPASDLYSAGVVLYEMLTKTVPFSGDTAVAVVMSHVSKNVPSPSELVPGLDPQLDDVVATATARSPADRYDSARAMETALHALSPQPGFAPSDLGFERSLLRPEYPDRLEESAGAERVDMRRGRRLGRVVAGLALLLLVVAGAALLGPDLLSREPDQEAPRPESPAPPSNSAGSPSPAPSSELPQTQVLPPTDTPPSGAPGYVLRAQVVGSPADEVADILRGEGFFVRVEFVGSSEEEGTIVATDPATGEQIVAGDTVTLQVSGGPDSA